MWFWTLIIIVAVWWIFKKNLHSTDNNLRRELFVSETKDISEENILKYQSEFEENLEKDYLPDAIRFNDAYIYKNLMRIWFNKLSSKNRYDDSMTQKLRKDWLDYMVSLSEGHTCNYLSFENYGKDEDKENSYQKRSVMAARKSRAIEDGFAAAMGEDATNELKHIRSLGVSSFSRTGQLAPNGMEFDLLGELRSKKDE